MPISHSPCRRRSKGPLPSCLRNRRKVYLNAVVWLAARVSMASAFIVTAVCLTMLLLAAAAASTDEARSDLDAADSISPLA